jgi:hypothetical protein
VIRSKLRNKEELVGYPGLNIKNIVDSDFECPLEDTKTKKEAKTEPVEETLQYSSDYSDYGDRLL